jgi:hypothetical protein
MVWNLENCVVEGLYMGDPEFPIRGRVELSRVMYGGRISHHVELHQPIKVFGAIRDRVIIEHQYISRVCS